MSDSISIRSLPILCAVLLDRPNSPDKVASFDKLAALTGTSSVVEPSKRFINQEATLPACDANSIAVQGPSISQCPESLGKGSDGLNGSDGLVIKHVEDSPSSHLSASTQEAQS